VRDLQGADEAEGPGGWLLGALGPALAMGAGAAVAYAAIRPPLSMATGLTRWDAAPWIGAAGLMLSLWMVAAPATAALMLGLERLAGLRRRRVAAAAGAAALAAAGLALGAALCLDLGRRLVAWRRTAGAAS
jgi:hypothetical protein